MPNENEKTKIKRNERAGEMEVIQQVNERTFYWDIFVNDCGVSADIFQARQFAHLSLGPRTQFWWLAARVGSVMKGLVQNSAIRLSDWEFYSGRNGMQMTRK
ncbi:hypothetical protein AVEN_72811-1 [Araneus ventricosus]|uniref:Uncharacterized protein n=1 Tax=Araneus ventricosus TaxID=182803 RepID=A0A4Y2RYW0_ARAVE|nr:hypothetical protein AVEN_72811-1 [Araneus ventricosus]